LFAIDETHKRTEIGYVIGRDHWQQGFATEIVPRVIDFAFDELGLHRIEADIDPRNTGSIRIVERLGFRREGLLRERYHVNGEKQDSALFGLLKPDWTDK
jgi:RimJ/RimL family protein N-acetyltransferase